MKIMLKQRPKNPIIIQGFPGFGLVGTIATEFLIKHLNAKPIGKIWSEGLMPIVAVHESRVVEPLGIFYDKKDNIVILHALSGVKGLEWQIAESVSRLCKELRAREVISLEGVGSTEGSSDVYYYSRTEKTQKALEKIGLKPLKEGIIIGVTGALMLKPKLNMSCIFAESHVDLADSMAAANIIKTLDRYLNLKVDYQPLMKAAEKFEMNLRHLMKKNEDLPQGARAKKLDYLG